MHCFPRGQQWPPSVPPSLPVPPLYFSIIITCSHDYQLSSPVFVLLNYHHVFPWLSVVITSLWTSQLSSRVPMIISDHHQSLAISAISSVNHVISYQLSPPVFGHQCHLQCKPQYHISTVSIYLCNPALKGRWHHLWKPTKSKKKNKNQQRSKKQNQQKEK